MAHDDDQAYVDGPGLGWMDPPDFAEDADTVDVPVHRTKCPGCGKMVETWLIIDGGHVCGLVVDVERESKEAA